MPRQRRAPASTSTRAIRIVGARGNNLKGVDVDIPVGLLTCVTGVSGSGKSTLVNDTLYAAVARKLYQSHAEPAPHDTSTGWTLFDKVINVDQSPIGRTPRSNPATYTGLFTPIRELFAEVPAHGSAVWRGPLQLQRGRRRCDASPRRRRDQGGDALPARRLRALRRLPGPRYNRETLEILYKGRNIAQVLELTVEDATRSSRRAHARAQAADAAGRGPGLRAAGAERHHAVGRRGPA